MEFPQILESTFTEVINWFSSAELANILANNSVWLSTLMGLFVGVMIAAHYAKKMALKGALERQQLANEADKNEIDGYLQALHVESKIVFENFQNKIGKEIESLSEGGALLQNYVQNSDYFFVYNANSQLLGRISNDALRLQIVKANTLFKILLDSLMYNDVLYKQYCEITVIAELSQKPIDEGRVQRQLNIIKQHAKILQKEQVLMAAQMSQMLSMLRSHRQEKGVVF
ncbi:MAG: hypothetical protein ACI9ES_000467 [Oceanospirillaceae bacterium]|jgi:hypothetical protein